MARTTCIHRPVFTTWRGPISMTRPPTAWRRAITCAHEAPLFERLPQGRYTTAANTGPELPPEQRAAPWRRTNTIGRSDLARPAGFVKITPLGSHDGESVGDHRALVLEDPDGNRACCTTPAAPSPAPIHRLGNIDIGSSATCMATMLAIVTYRPINAGDCAAPEFSVRPYPTPTASYRAGEGATIDHRQPDAEVLRREAEGHGPYPEMATGRFGASKRSTV